MLLMQNSPVVKLPALPVKLHFQLINCCPLCHKAYAIRLMVNTGSAGNFL